MVVLVPDADAETKAEVVVVERDGRGDNIDNGEVALVVDTDEEENEDASNPSRSCCLDEEGDFDSDDDEDDVEDDVDLGDNDPSDVGDIQLLLLDDMMTQFLFESSAPVLFGVSIGSDGSCTWVSTSRTL